jgi:predicted small metal-binding protein
VLATTTGAEQMKSFACGDVVPGCTASWVSSTDDEILVLVAQHARAVHGIPAVTPELTASITDRIVAVS